MGRAVFPPSCLTWDQTMVEIMKIMATSFKRSHAHTAALSAPNPAAGHGWPTIRDSWTRTGKSESVFSEVTAPFSWVLVHTMFYLCPPRVCLPRDSKFCNQIPLASKVKFPGGSQTLCQIPRLENLLWVLELILTVWKFIWYNCSAVCGSSAQWLHSGVNGNLFQEGLGHTLCDPGLLRPESLPLQQATADLYLHRRHSNTQRQVCLSVCGVSGSWCAPGFVWALRASLAGMGFDSKCDFAPPTVLMGLLLCLWMWGILFWWDPTFSCVWLFSSEF